MNTTTQTWNPALADTREIGAEVLDGKVFITVNGVTVGVIQLDHGLLGSNTHDYVTLLARGVEYRVEDESAHDQLTRFSGRIGVSSEQVTQTVSTVDEMNDLADLANTGRNGYYTRSGESIAL